MHAGRVHPGKERPVGLDLPLHEIDRGGGGLVVDRFHPFGIEWAGVLDLAVAGCLQHAKPVIPSL